MKFKAIAGFAIPAAIFLIVILAGLGAFLVSITSGQQVGLALDVNGERAWQAANAGMDWVRYRVATDSACPANTTWGASSNSLDFSANSSTLQSFKATVECQQVESTDVDGVSTTVFEVRVTACNQPASGKCPGVATGFGYVERQMQGILGI